MPLLPLPTSLLLAVLGAVMTELAFPSTSWWPAAFLGIALLLQALRGARAGRGFLVGFVWGSAFFLPHLWWARESTAEVPWLLLSLSQAAFIGLFGSLYALISRRRGGTSTWWQVLGATAVWTGVEALRGVAPFGGFTWGALAFSQTDGPLLRLAALGGMPAVTAATVAVGALVWAAGRQLGQLRIAVAGVYAIVAFALVALTFVIPVGSRAESGTLRIGAVQGNVPADGFRPGSIYRDVLERHVAGTLALAESGVELDVVLWPENSADYDPRVREWAAVQLDEASRAVDAPILAGGTRYVDDGRYNDMFLWEPGVGEVQRYSKQRPAPFGEYIPMRDLARRITDQVDRVQVDMLPGQEPATVALPVERLDRDVILGLAICFEVAYMDLTGQAVLDGAEMLVVPTNNSSFGLTEESSQQLAMSVFQAVTHGRAVVHVSNVGVSAVISPNGVVQQRTGHYTAEQFVATVPLRESITLATRLGQWPAILAGVASVLLVGTAVLPDGRRADGDRPRRRRGTR